MGNAGFPLVTDHKIFIIIIIIKPISFGHHSSVECAENALPSSAQAIKSHRQLQRISANKLYSNFIVSVDTLFVSVYVCTNIRLNHISMFNENF